VSGIVVVALAVVVAAFALVVLAAWDRLVFAGLVGVFAGASHVVAQAEGRWWFWPAMLGAAVVVVAAFVVAVLIS
jgi:hypothetical protein